MNTRRLFFALWPDDRQRDQLRNTISPAAREIEGEAVFRGNWHVTLSFLGEIGEEKIPQLQKAAGGVQCEPFRLRFDRVEFWPRPKVAVLSAQTVPQELMRLVAMLNAVGRYAGVEPEDRPFRPHITIVRRARTFETQRLAQAADVSWSGFRLVESLREAGKPVYRPLDQ